MKRAAEILRCAARDQQVEDHIIFKACNYAKAVRMVLAARKTRIPITSFCLQYWGTTSACAGPAAISATTAFWLCTTTGALVVLLHLLLISCSSFTSANRCFSTAPPSDSSFIGLEKHNRFINLKELYGAAFITTHGRNIAAATTTVEDPDHIAIYLSKSRRKSPEVIDHVRQQAADSILAPLLQPDQRPDAAGQRPCPDAAAACNHHHKNNNNNYNILLLRQRLEITKTATSNLLQLLMTKLTWWTKDMMQIQLHMVRDLHKSILNLYDPATAAVAANHNIAAAAHIQRRPRRMMSSSSRVHIRTRRRKLMLPESSNSYESPKHAAAAANFPHTPSSNDFFGDYRDPQSHPPRSN